MAERLTYSIKETAERTGLSRSFLYLEMERGELATVKRGHRRLIQADDLAAYLAAGRQEARAA